MPSANELGPSGLQCKSANLARVTFGCASERDLDAAPARPDELEHSDERAEERCKHEVAARRPQEETDPHRQHDVAEERDGRPEAWPHRMDHGDSGIGAARSQARPSRFSAIMRMIRRRV